MIGKFCLNIKLIWNNLQNRELYCPLLFFVITGLVVPNLEDVLYYFLLDTCKLSKEQYDILNMMQSVGIVLGTAMFIAFFKETEVWKLITFSFIAQIIEAILQYANVQRWNLAWNIPDFHFNIGLFMVGRATMISFSVLPMTVMLMNTVPKNIEASMFAVITAAITFSTDWAGDLVGAVYCDFFGITNKDLSKFGHIIRLKIFVVIACIFLISKLLPSNEEIKALGRRLNDSEDEDDDKISQIASGGSNAN
jgi:hypothetical protein